VLANSTIFFNYFLLLIFYLPNFLPPPPPTHTHTHSGRRGALWNASTLGLGYARDGQAPPDEEDVYEFMCDSFLCTSDLRIVPQ
jgi:hypothetical protein